MIVLLQSFFHYGCVGEGGDHSVALLARRTIKSVSVKNFFMREVMNEDALLVQPYEKLS